MIGVMSEQVGRKTPRLHVIDGVGAMMSMIRGIATDTSRVFLTDHAVNRMFQRGIDAADVYKALRFGEIQGAPWIEDDQCRACKVVLSRKGDRTIGVITILLDAESELVVKTVEWEDWE